MIDSKLANASESDLKRLDRPAALVSDKEKRKGIKKVWPLYTGLTVFLFNMFV